MTTLTRHRSERIEKGIERVHRKDCSYLTGARCNQKCSYRAEVYDRGSGRSARKTHRELSSARRWRIQKGAAIISGLEQALKPERLGEALDQWFDDAMNGVIISSSDEQYKPATMLAYRSAIKLHLKPALGRHNVNELRTTQVQDLVDKLHKGGMAASTVQSVLAPLSVFYSWAIRNELATTSPCINVKTRSPAKRSVTIPPPAEAVLRLQVLQEAKVSQRIVGVWAAAFFAGLRRGEAIALDWEHVDLAERVLRVDRSFDYHVHEDQRYNKDRNEQIIGFPDRGSGAYVKPKTSNGVREIGIPELLIPFLEASDRREGLLFGIRPNRPLPAHSLTAKVHPVWEAKKLALLKLHDARHTYASLSIAAGVDLVEISRRMGHSSISITVDTYGHLLPNGAVAAADKLNAYLSSHL